MYIHNLVCARTNDLLDLKIRESKKMTVTVFGSLD
jgi:hypothetical protein